MPDTLIVVPSARRRWRRADGIHFRDAIEVVLYPI
jgi:hypothetical protein